MSQSPEPLESHRETEALVEELSPEEQCLQALFDLVDIDDVGAYHRCSEYFSTQYDQEAPADLRTSLQTLRIVPGKNNFWPGIFPEGVHVIATLTVGFETINSSLRGMQNIDFVGTEHGLLVLEKDWIETDGRRTPTYIRALSDTELAAIRADSAVISSTILETDAERLKLGPLCEEADPNGIRRFHVGDILSIITGRLLSPRGMDGIHDILSYMTKDTVYTLQLGRFAEECLPALHEQFDALLAEYYEVPAENLVDALSALRWLGELGRTLGEPLLVVQPLAREAHAVIDHLDELELDHGSDMMKRISILDLDNNDSED